MKGYEYEAPLTTCKAREIDIEASDFLFRMMSLNEGEITQIIGGKCELVNEGP